MLQRQVSDKRILFILLYGIKFDWNDHLNAFLSVENCEMTVFSCWKIVCFQEKLNHYRVKMYTLMFLAKSAGAVGNGKPDSGALKWIVDVTIGYPQGQPLDVFAILFGHRSPCTTQVSRWGWTDTGTLLHSHLSREIATRWPWESLLRFMRLRIIFFDWVKHP